MEMTTESIRDQIPYYLTAEQKEHLVLELKKFPSGTEYYLKNHLYPDDPLQGDCWTKLQAFQFETGERSSIQGILLSNTCDMSPENKRELPIKITFAPIISLTEYTKLLNRSGIEPTKIKTKTDSIKKQLVTNMFYLPNWENNSDEDFIALLDQVHTMPARFFFNDPQKIKKFTLSQVGFYLFILKLSIHFCRFKENISRN